MANLAQRDGRAERRRRKLRVELRVQRAIPVFDCDGAAAADHVELSRRRERVLLLELVPLGLALVDLGDVDELAVGEAQEVDERLECHALGELLDEHELGAAGEGFEAGWSEHALE